jgi:predicted 2-oxoglutarate/Fe(II)-dependent dioxygenase YbiX
VKTHSRLSAGDRVPDFVMPGPAGSPAHFYALAGGSPVTLLLGQQGVAGHTEIADALSHRDDVDVVHLDGDLSAEVFGVPVGASTVLVLDRNLRVVGEVASAQPAHEVAAMLDLLLPVPPATRVSDQAPVLFVPRVLDTDERLRLIGVFHQQGEVETGVERAAAGTRGEVIDESFKRRRDHAVHDAELLRELSASVGRRVMPEIRKAFAFRATRFEGFKIGCYDGSTGGFFRPHRDNLSPSTAHRVFALTLNLNDDYTGGELRFPEYGNQLYRPDAGAALIFSCSHLHEVREVTGGRRFVLLSFLYGESAVSPPR